MLSVLGLVLRVSVAAAAETDSFPSGGAADTPASTLPEVDNDESAPEAVAPRLVVTKPLTPADLPPPNVFSPQRPFLGSAPTNWRPRGDGASYRAIVEREAAAFSIPPDLVDAVMAVESGYNPNTLGADGEIGLMQLLPSTATMLGFTGSLAELAVPETNIHYGVMYLAAAWRLAGQDICTTTMKYRAGHGETRFSFRSVDYCTRVRAHMVARGYPVTGTVPTPTFGQPFGVSSRGRLQFARGGGMVDLTALNARLREVADSAHPAH